MAETFRENVERTLREWELAIDRQRHVRPDQERHGQEIVASLERAERRLGKDLANYKRALRER